MFEKKVRFVAFPNVFIVEHNQYLFNMFWISVYGTSTYWRSPGLLPNDRVWEYLTNT